jgi:hypothetical protein
MTEDSKPDPTPEKTERRPASTFDPNCNRDTLLLEILTTADRLADKNLEVVDELVAFRESMITLWAKMLSRLNRERLTEAMNRILDEWDKPEQYHRGGIKLKRKGSEVVKA